MRARGRPVFVDGDGFGDAQAAHEPQDDGALELVTRYLGEQPTGFSDVQVGRLAIASRPMTIS